MKPHATAAAAPPDDPPVVRPRSHGLLVVPNSTLWVWKSADQVGALVLPNNTPPAAERRATAGASTAGTWSASAGAPPVERMPPVSMASFTVNGSPCRGPRHVPVRGVLVSLRWPRSCARATFGGDDGIDLRIEPVDLGETRSQELPARQGAGSDRRRQSGGRPEGGVIRHGIVLLVARKWPRFASSPLIPDRLGR